MPMPMPLPMLMPIPMSLHNIMPGAHDYAYA